MCEQSRQRFDVVWGVCLEQMPWKRLEASAKYTLESRSRSSAAASCGISSRGWFKYRHIAAIFQARVWKICTRKGWVLVVVGGGQMRGYQSHIYFCQKPLKPCHPLTDPPLPSSLRKQRRAVGIVLQRSHNRQSPLMCSAYRLSVCGSASTNQYKP